MRFRFQPWHLALVVILLCVAGVAVIHWRSVSRPVTAISLIEYLPPDRAAHVYVDVSALRNSGLLDVLAGSKAAEEPDYTRFVERTGFDYRSDLDAVAAAFLRGNSYMVLRGHFDWKRLNDYARAEEGSCLNGFCTMPASSPDRHISFYPIKSDILAMAVSSEVRGTDMIGPKQWRNPPSLPAEPVWVSVPPFMFADVSGLPNGTHSFLTPLAQSQGVTFAAGPRDQQLQVRVEVICATPEAAAALSTQLTSTTDLLKHMIAREHMTPNPRDLSGVLAAGNFKQQGRNVTGAWAIERGFIEALASGQLQ